MAKPTRSYVISLDNRKARGSGHERRSEILAAARNLFLERGIENVSTRQIAARVGISQTALYVYFRNKEEMLGSLVDAAFSTLGAALQQGPADPDDLVGRLRAAIVAYVRFGLDHPDEYRLAFVLQDTRRPDPSAAVQRGAAGARAFAMLETLVSAGLAAGVFRSFGDDAGTAQSIWAATHGLVALLIAQPNFGWVDTDRLIGIHVRMLLGGVVRGDAAEPVVAAAGAVGEDRGAKP